MPASSFVSNPTRTLGSLCRGNLRNTASSVAGLSFAAQPAAFAIEVSFTDEAKSHLAVNRFDYSEVWRFVLAHPWKTVVGLIEIRRPSAGNDPFLSTLNQRRLRSRSLLALPLLRPRSWP